MDHFIDVSFIDEGTKFSLENDFPSSSNYSVVELGFQSKATIQYKKGYENNLKVKGHSSNMCSRWVGIEHIQG